MLNLGGNYCSTQSDAKLQNKREPRKTKTVLLVDFLVQYLPLALNSSRAILCN